MMDPSLALADALFGEEPEKEQHLLAKHRRVYVHAGRQFRCPVHDVMEVLVAVEETWVEGGGPGYRERLSE